MKPRVSRRVRRGLETLKPRDREILRLRYAEGLTYERIGVELGLSRERIRQICSRAEKRLALAIAHPTEAPKAPPQRPPPRTMNWTSEGPAGSPGLAVALAPFGTLGDVLELLDNYPLEEKRRLLNEALAHLKGDEPDTKETPSGVRRGTLD